MRLAYQCLVISVSGRVGVSHVSCVSYCARIEAPDLGTVSLKTYWPATYWPREGRYRYFWLIKETYPETALSRIFKIQFAYSDVSAPQYEYFQNTRFSAVSYGFQRKVPLRFDTAAGLIKGAPFSGQTLGGSLMLKRLLRVPLDLARVSGVPYDSTMPPPLPDRKPQKSV